MSLADQRHQDALRATARQQRLHGSKDPNKLFELFEAHTKMAPATLGKYAEPFSAHMSGLTKEVVQPFLSKRHAIRTSARYSPQGEREELGINVRAALADVAKRREQVTTRIGADVEQRRAAARRREASPEDATLRYLRLRDIRDYIEKRIDLRAVDATGQPVELMMALEKAIARGVGFDWLEALDQAVVPLVDPQIVATIRNRICDGSDPELEALAALQHAHEYALNTIARGLEDAAAEDLVQVTAPEAAPPAAQAGPYFGSGQEG